MRKFLFLLILGFSQIVFSESSKSDKDLYDLQDKCRKTTESEFRKEWGSNGTVNDKETLMISNYTNHYNKKHNECFYLLTTNSYPKQKKSNGITQMISLWDIQENKNYGEFDSLANKVFICKVGEFSCGNKKEFEALLVPFMND